MHLEFEVWNPVSMKINHTCAGKVAQSFQSLLHKHWDSSSSLNACKELGMVAHQQSQPQGSQTKDPDNHCPALLPQCRTRSYIMIQGHMKPLPSVVHPLVTPPGSSPYAGLSFVSLIQSQSYLGRGTSGKKMPPFNFQ